MKTLPRFNLSFPLGHSRPKANLGECFDSQAQTKPSRHLNTPQISRDQNTPEGINSIEQKLTRTLFQNCIFEVRLPA
jgi:hypothetical protein